MLSCVTSLIAAAGAVVGSSPGGSSRSPIVTVSLAAKAGAGAARSTSAAESENRADHPSLPG